MSLGTMLEKEGVAFAVMEIIIVLFIIILGNINGQVNTILSGTGATSNATIKTFISTTSTGLSEPKNWIAISMIAIIGFGIIKFVRDKEE